MHRVLQEAGQGVDMLRLRKLRWPHRPRLHIVRQCMGCCRAPGWTWLQRASCAGQRVWLAAAGAGKAGPGAAGNP